MHAAELDISTKAYCAIENNTVQYNAENDVRVGEMEGEMKMRILRLAVCSVD